MSPDQSGCWWQDSRLLFGRGYTLPESGWCRRLGHLLVKHTERYTDGWRALPLSRLFLLVLVLVAGACGSRGSEPSIPESGLLGQDLELEGASSATGGRDISFLLVSTTALIDGTRGPAGVFLIEKGGETDVDFHLEVDLALGNCNYCDNLEIRTVLRLFVDDIGPSPIASAYGVGVTDNSSSVSMDFSVDSLGALEEGSHCLIVVSSIVAFGDSEPLGAVDADAFYGLVVGEDGPWHCSLYQQASVAPNTVWEETSTSSEFSCGHGRLVFREGTQLVEAMGCTHPQLMVLVSLDQYGFPLDCCFERIPVPLYAEGSLVQLSVDVPAGTWRSLLITRPPVDMDQIRTHHGGLVSWVPVEIP